MNTYFRWFLDEKSHPWVIHQCSDLLDYWRLPPPWRVQGEGISPSLHCQECGCHVVVGAADRASENEILEARLERLLRT